MKRSVSLFIAVLTSFNLISPSSLWAVRPSSTADSQGLSAFRSELRGQKFIFDDKTVFNYLSTVHIQDEKTRKLIGRLQDRIRELGSKYQAVNLLDFTYGFSNFNFNKGDRIGFFIKWLFENMHENSETVPENVIEDQIFSQILKMNRHLPDQERITIPDLSHLQDKFMDHPELMDPAFLESLKLSSRRYPLSGIIFFNPPADRANFEIIINEKSYVIPSKVPVWFLENGFMLLNAGNLKSLRINNEEELIILMNNLAYSLTPPPLGHDYEVIPLKTARSEIRLQAIYALEQIAKEIAVSGPELDLDKTFILSKGESLIIDSSYFLRKEGDSYLLDEKALAIALAVFPASGGNVIMFGLPDDHPAVKALRSGLPAQISSKILFSDNAEEVISWVRKPGISARAILSDNFDLLAAESLKKQLGDKSVLMMTLREFSQKAAAVAERFGLQSLADALRNEIAANISILKSA